MEREGASTRFGMDAIIATATSAVDADAAATAAAVATSNAAATFHVAVARCSLLLLQCSIFTACVCSSAKCSFHRLAQR